MRFNRQARAGYKYWPPCGVPVNMQHQCQQSLFMNPCVLQFINRMVDIPAVCRSWYAQCTLCSRPWTFTGTVLRWLFMRLLLCSDRCPGWGAQKTVEFRSCRFSGVAQCLVRLWIHVLHHPGWLLEEFYDFPRDWVDSDPEVNSRRSLHTWPMRM